MKKKRKLLTLFILYYDFRCVAFDLLMPVRQGKKSVENVHFTVHGSSSIQNSSLQLQSHRCSVQVRSSDIRYQVSSSFSMIILGPFIGEGLCLINDSKIVDVAVKEVAAEGAVDRIMYLFGA